MERYDYINPIFYTEGQADDVLAANHEVLFDDKLIPSRVSNKADFLKKLTKVVMDDEEEHFLSFKRVANGRISLHLHRDSGFINLGKFDVDPDLVTATYLKDKDAIEHFAFEEVSYRLYSAMLRVMQNEYRYDSGIVDDHLRKRFDLQKFPEVEILGNVRLDQDEYAFMKNAHDHLEAIRSSRETNLRDEYISTSPRFEFSTDLTITLDELYLDHLDEGEQQVAYFEPVYYEIDGKSGVMLRKTELLLAEKGVSPRTSSSLFCIRTDEEIAFDYEDALRDGTWSKMRTRFEAMSIAISMSLVDGFERNCVLADNAEIIAKKTL